MIITMKKNCPKSQVGEVIAALRALELNPHIITPEPRIVLGVVDEISSAQAEQTKDAVKRLHGVEEINSFENSWKLVSNSFHPQATTIKLGEKILGSPEVLVIAGPCAVESQSGYLEAARAVADRGASALRGGAFKPRTSPYSFRGLGEQGLKIMSQAREITGLPFVTEVMRAAEVELVAGYADVLQIGARNMQNFSLLEAVGDLDIPVLLKRGMMATLKELLLSAEYILARGNGQVMLCERGVRTFETATRNTLDVSAVCVLKQLTHLPVVVDPSHAAGKREYVPGLAAAAVAAGADALMVEVHPQPDQALSDGRQSLTLPGFAEMMDCLQKVAGAVGRSITGPKFKKPTQAKLAEAL
jgi:3-deoxy-7-phosphoheptulonate synthase